MRLCRSLKRNINCRCVTYESGKRYFCKKIGKKHRLSCYSVALLLGSFSGNATALAQRQPDNTLNSREDCVRKYGHMSYYGVAMTMSSGNDTTNVWCIHNVAQETNLVIPGGSNEFSYARDNLRMFIPMKTHISRLRVNIPGGTSGQGEPASLRQMGQTFEHNLQPIGNDGIM